MEHIFEKLYNAPIEDHKQYINGKIFRLFLSKDPIITKEFIPIIIASFKNEEFQKSVMLSYKEKIEKELQSAVNDQKNGVITLNFSDYMNQRLKKSEMNLK